ncbi:MULTISPECIES: hypothetical protein [Streptomyces]|uniref:hypothetical protein n=1 Tax=Streptomyces TaxID=1883 RepID=UPI00167920CD|nr:MULTISPECIES: hypothetical protein [Streptomyces]MBK3526210.1 hypothetical protein [Streptomyces sp. MBT70]GGR57396.1 hypothetical protein GCM10010236_06990 [Streptomyces eurythermus]
MCADLGGETLRHLTPTVLKAARYELGRPVPAVVPGDPTFADRPADPSALLTLTAGPANPAGSPA